MKVYVGYEGQDDGHENSTPLEVFTDKAKLLDWIMANKFTRCYKEFDTDVSS